MTTYTATNTQNTSDAASYWVRAAREQSRWAAGLTAEYRAATHAKKRARLWQERRRCLDRIPVFMANARQAKAAQS